MDEITRRLIMGAAGAGEKIYIEDVFSTYLHTGNDSTQTITNGIDLSGKGGLVWIKPRTVATSHSLFTTSVGSVGQYLGTNYTSALQPNNGQMLQSFNASGFTLGSDNFVNASSGSGGGTYASWTFRKSAKFFDVVTYVGDGNANLAVSHNLGSVPGTIIVKCTSTGSTSWKVYHRSLGRNTDLSLNTNEQAYTTSNFWGTSDPTSTQFYVGSAGATSLNGSGQTYVAYLFAHDAGGFGDSGNESVVKCGSYTGDGTSDRLINLGWEAQWVLLRPANNTADWIIYDTQRGAPITGGSNRLSANLANAETNNGNSYVYPDPLGFRVLGAFFTNNLPNEYIYIAIRRGPMKTPTDATKVFSAIVQTGSGNLDVSGSFPPDLDLIALRSGGQGPYSGARLTGATYLTTSSTAAQGTTTPLFSGNGTQNNVRWISAASDNYINWLFRRAPGFFDVVAYTGTGSARTVSHNLGVAPELMIVKQRSSSTNWAVYSAPRGNTEAMFLNFTDSSFAFGSSIWNNTTPTSTAFSVGTAGATNASSGTYIAYLFASCPGVSKVGSYTGTGTTQQINCGFTNGARFVLIKRTDSTGDWYVWDTARGINAANDPYMLLNSTAAEVTNTDYIDPYSAGFEISSTAPAAINANGGSFIYLAIA